MLVAWMAGMKVAISVARTADCLVDKMAGQSVGLKAESLVVLKEL